MLLDSGVQVHRMHLDSDKCCLSLCFFLLLLCIQACCSDLLGLLLFAMAPSHTLQLGNVNAPFSLPH